MGDRKLLFDITSKYLHVKYIVHKCLKIYFRMTLKQGDALSLLFFSFALDYSIMQFQEN
jgi:hypothetical protein